MNVTHILNFNHLGGKTGSARLIDTLMTGLDPSKFQFHNLVGYQFLPQANTTSLYETRPTWFYRNIRYKLAIGLNFLFDWMTPGSIKMSFLRNFEPYIRADIIHLHCIQGGYFDWRILPEISKEKKVIMTLHDDWLISGNDSENLFHPYKTRSQYLKRKEIFQKSAVTFIGVSNWITDKVKKDEIVGNNSIKTIYNGIDTSIFFSQNKKTCRHQLGLPENKKIILSIAGSGGTSNAKGLQYVRQIIAKYRNNPEFLFVTLGNYKSKSIQDGLKEVEYVSREMVAKYFNAADLFLYPTLMDSFGLIVAEGLACGCPVIAFNTGGVPEVIGSGDNGYIARYKDFDDLFSGFDQFFLTRKPDHKVLLDKNFTKESLIQKYSAEYFCIKGV